MKGRGIIVEAADTLPDGTAIDRAGAFRELLRGGLSDSPIFRQVFQETCCDETHPVTMHVRSQFPGIVVDAFRFDPTRPAGSRSNQAGHHTFDLSDIGKFPRVGASGQPNLSLEHQIVLHGLREARQGALGNNYLPSHFRAIDDENAFRAEQGQIGVKDHNQPTAVAAGAQQIYTQNGAVLLTETINLNFDDITSITSAP